MNEPIAKYPPGFTSQLRALIFCAPAVFMLGLMLLFTVEAVSEAIQSGNEIGVIVLSIKKFYWSFLAQMGGNPFYYLAIPVALILQFLRPAQQNLPLFGPSARVDIVLSLVMVAFYALFAPPFLAFLRFVYDTLFGWLSIDTGIELSLWSQIILGYLLADFLGWLHHVVRHKVPVFWEFHQIHHAQKNMNPFTNERVHPLDWAFAYTVKFVPVFAFQDSLEIIVSYILITRSLDIINHSNIRSNFGWLRFVLVTPQSHRIHHSILPEHRDRNLGITLCIWDRIFGTHVDDIEHYPETGVAGSHLTPETDGSLLGVLSTSKSHLVYPFVNAWKNRYGNITDQTP